jgi:hypothetical protein
MEPVYYKVNDSTFPSDSPEALGYWVGVAEHVGHTMTSRVWCKTTNKVIDRSVLRPALLPGVHNARAGSLPHNPYYDWLRRHLSPTDPPSPHCQSSQDYGEIFPGRPPDFVRSDQDTNDVLDSTDYGEQYYLSDSAPSQDTEQKSQVGPRDVILRGLDGFPKKGTDGKPILITGRTDAELEGISFLHRQDDGTQERATVIHRREDRLKGQDAYDSFIIKYNRSQVEDVMSYNDIMNYLHRDQLADDGTLWQFRRIISHQGPLTSSDRHWKGSSYNLEIEWENGEISYEPLTLIKDDDPITVSKYAMENNMLELPGWRSLKRYARRQKKLSRLVNQVRLRSFRTSPRYKYGFRVPRDWNEAVRLDKENDNHKWHIARDTEMNQLDEYLTFIDKGKFSKHKIPRGYKKITAHLIFDVKHDGRHKARMVAGGHLTDTPLESVYAGVVSLRGLRTCIFLAELNGLVPYATDIGNAYLEAKTREKVCIRAGPEFKEREGNLLIIHKALYGLKSSGKEFGELLAECLKELGFNASKAEPEIFMRKNGDIWEYVATYVDDLCLVMKEPKQFLETLKATPYSFKLKGSGPLEFHLGCGFRRDVDNHLVMDPIKYIEKMMDGYKQFFNKLPTKSKCMSPVENDYHPELDTSEFLDDEDTQKYQSMVGSLQWLITIGRWDIMTSVMSLSSYRAQPRKGHLEAVKRIYAYVNRTKHYTLKFRVDPPDMSKFDRVSTVTWDKSVYGETEEDIPHDAPEPLGKEVVFIHYFDANLMHDVISGKAVTGCLHLANKTPIMWHSKKQATSETATYGAEFIAGRTCVEQTIDLRNTFRYLGVKVRSTSYMFGDNESMIDSASYPHSRLRKRHNILSFHYVRSQIARGYINLKHIGSKDNASDVLSKHWSYQSVKTLLKPFFNSMGNTANLYVDDSADCLDNTVKLIDI